MKLIKVNDKGYLDTSAVGLDEAATLELRECKSEQEIINLIHEMKKQNLQLLARRDLEKWGGALLFFGDKNLIEKK